MRSISISISFMPCPYSTSVQQGVLDILCLFIMLSLFPSDSVCFSGYRRKFLSVPDWQDIQSIHHFQGLKITMMMNPGLLPKTRFLDGSNKRPSIIIKSDILRNIRIRNK